MADLGKLQAQPNGINAVYRLLCAAAPQPLHQIMMFRPFRRNAAIEAQAMSRRLSGHPAAVISVIVAAGALVVAALLVVVGYLSIYLSEDSDGSVPRSVLVMLTSFAWLGAPYLAMIAAAAYFAPWKYSAAVLLVATACSCVYGSYYTAHLALTATSSMAVLGFFIMPLLQNLGLLAVVGIAFALSYIGR